MVTEQYAYTLVSLKLGGELDWAAIKRATAKGWEPVPLGEEPNPFPNPMGMSNEAMQAFKLCRMPIDKHRAITEELEFLNEALIDDRVHYALAARNIEDFIAAKQLTVDEQNKPENALGMVSYANHSRETEPYNSARFRRKVEVAGKWLRDRGLL